MKTHRLNFEQKIPISLTKAWNFFSSPQNLSAITPPYMNFRVTSNISVGAKMYEGMIITYQVSPLFGLKLDWMTEITTVKENEYFIDEQKFGPFKYWHHEHHFEEISDGVLMRDQLTYMMPFGFLGSIAHAAIVKKQTKDIFTFREKAIERLFGEY